MHKILEDHHRLMARRQFLKTSGMGLGLVFFLLYYFLLAAGMVFGETGAYSPALGMWMPNIIMGITGIWFLKRVACDKPIYIDRFFEPFEGYMIKVLKFLRLG